MTEKNLSEVFVDTLKDIYYAENKSINRCRKWLKPPTRTSCEPAFEKHHDETDGQIERLEQIFEQLGKPARGKKCDAIEGILDEEGNYGRVCRHAGTRCRIAGRPPLKPSSTTRFPVMAR